MVYPRRAPGGEAEGIGVNEGSVGEDPITGREMPADAGIGDFEETEHSPRKCRGNDDHVGILD